MPVFDFECNGKCKGKPFEVVLCPGEKEPEKCPVCGSTKIQKLFNFTCRLQGLTRKSQPDDQPDLTVVRHTIIGIG